MIPMKSKPPSKQHEAFRDDMVAALRKHQHLPPDEMLAIASYFVGQLLAMQDQRKMTAAMGLQIVSINIEAGNQHVIAELAGAVPGGNS